MKYGFTFLLALLVSGPAVAEGRSVSYEVDGETFEGYYISPSSKSPLVLMVHDWDGLTDYEIKRANMLASMGYAVFALDLYGKGNRPEEMQQKRAMTASLYQDRERMRRLLRGGLEAARQQGGNTGNAVAMGYCFGGAAVLEWARSGATFKGFVTFHGGLQTPEGQDYSKTRGKLLILHGTADSSVSMQDFAALAMQLESAGVEHEMITYSGAPHAFTVFGSQRYHKDADEKSWRRFGEYLQDTLQ